MKTDATLKQAGKVLELIGQKETPCEQLQRLLESGLFSDLLEANLENGVDRDAFRRLVGLKSLNPPLLESLGTVTVSATERFVAREKFVRDTNNKAAVKISYVGDNFSEWFLNKIEEPRPETQLRYAKLTRPSKDDKILAELGEKKETALAEIYRLMMNQPNGEDGILLTNGWANIFYIRDVNGGFRAVFVRWFVDGWYVGAGSVGRPGGWRVGRRVFSRNS